MAMIGEPRKDGLGRQPLPQSSFKATGRYLGNRVLPTWQSARARGLSSERS